MPTQDRLPSYGLRSSDLVAGKLGQKSPVYLPFFLPSTKPDLGFTDKTQDKTQEPAAPLPALAAAALRLQLEPRRRKKDQQSTRGFKRGQAQPGPPAFQLDKTAGTTGGERVPGRSNASSFGCATRTLNTHTHTD